MTYVSADRYLRENGKIAFVITQSVWKAAGGGRGFRRFKIGNDGASLQVIHVDDIASIQVFEGASTRTSVFIMRKGAETRYPVPYTFWRKISHGQSIGYDSTLDEVLGQTKRFHFHAVPVDVQDHMSAWFTSRGRTAKSVREIVGSSPYRARVGIKASVNGVFWFEILTRRPDGMLVVRNMAERSKRDVESVTIDIEPDLV